MRLMCAALLSIASAIPLIAQSPAAARKPWQWTDGERIASRVNPQAAHERVVRGIETEKKHAAMNGTVRTAESEPFDMIDGKTNPELYLPYELFESLMRMQLSEDQLMREASQSAVEEQRKAVGLPNDFWARLEPLCSAYLADWKRLSDLHQPTRGYDMTDARVREETAGLEVLRCRDRGTALEGARREFGERLDIFLYTAIAPAISSAVLTQPDPKRLHYLNGGCR